MITALHTSGGEVWAAEDEQSPRSTGLPVDAYRFPAGARARVIGTADNAPLILALAAQGAVIDLAGPLAVCPEPRDLADPVLALYRTRQCLLGASLGGWHRYTEAIDGPAYRLAAAAPEDRLAVAADHPIWYDLQFITGADPRTLAAILADILDPRWFVDPRNPNRVGRLRQFFRISPRGLKRLFEEDCSPEIDRLRRVIRIIGNPAEATAEPGDFLRRVVANAADPARGLLAACRLFLDYLVRVWEQRIHVLSHSRQTEPLFLPELLFKEFEAQAWREFNIARPR